MSLKGQGVRSISSSTIPRLRPPAQGSAEDSIDGEGEPGSHGFDCSRGRALCTASLRLVRPSRRSEYANEEKSVCNGVTDTRRCMEMWGFRVRSYVEHYEKTTFLTVVVQDIKRNGAAEEAGLCKDDQILSVNGNPLKTVADSKEATEFLSQEDDYSLELIVLPAKQTKVNNVHIFPAHILSLDVLWCVRNQLTTLALWHVDLSFHDGLQEIDLTRLVLVNTLAVCHCRLDSLQKLKGLDRLQFLKYLRLCNNLLTCDDLGVDCSIAKISTIQTLMLDRNRLTEFPVCVFSLHQLEKLTLSYNFIKFIPRAISCLTELQQLSLDGNGLLEVDSNVLAIRSLKCLSVTKNRIEINPLLEKHSSLGAFAVQGNPFLSLPLAHSPKGRRDSRQRHRHGNVNTQRYSHSRNSSLTLVPSPLAQPPRSVSLLF